MNYERTQYKGKAKRYDEAKINGSRLWECGEITRENYEYMFPEIKESEDERIRKELIAEVKEQIDCIPAPDCRDKEDEKALKQLNKWLAWLENVDYANKEYWRGYREGKQEILDKYAEIEKQGKNNMSISEATKKELEDNLNKALEKETPESCNEFLEKQGEQKTAYNKDYSAPLDIEIPFGAKDSELIQETIRIPDGCYAFIEGNEIVIKKGEKPAWSEEDKAMVEDIIEAIDTQYAVTDYNEMVNWLKSLKDRVQPKVELTQLDKNILEAAIAFVEQNNHFNCWRGVDKHTVLSALHSLKPQNTWKPSDLQIEALDSATENCAYSEYQDCLRELIWQLKKLKGE